MTNRNMRGRLTRWTAALGAIALSGCYSYVPVERPSLGTPVRIQVPVPSAVINPNRPPEVVPYEGRLLVLDDSIVLETRTRREIALHREVVFFDTIRTARNSVAAIEEKVFSTPKTVAFSVGIVGVVLAVALGATNLTGGEGDEPIPDPPPEASISWPAAWRLLSGLIGG